MFSNEFKRYMNHIIFINLKNDMLSVSIKLTKKFITCIKLMKHKTHPLSFTHEKSPFLKHIQPLVQGRTYLLMYILKHS